MLKFKFKLLINTILYSKEINRSQKYELVLTTTAKFSKLTRKRTY